MKLFNRKPKIAKEDFIKDFLPKNRKEQFFDIVKNRFVSILLLGFIMLLFFCPFLLVFLFKDIITSSLYSSLTGEELTMSLNAYNLIFSACEVPCFMIMSLSIAGSLKVFRRMTYNEPIFFKNDFFTGIKENWRQYLISSFILGLFSFLSTVVVVLFGNNESMKFIQYIPLGITLAVIAPIMIETFFVSSLYDNKYSINFKLTLSIVVRSLLSLIIFCLILYAFIFFRYIALLTVKFICIVVSIVLVLPFYLLAFWLNEIRVFDKTVNGIYYPELVNKGLSTYNYAEKEKVNSEHFVGE